MILTPTLQAGFGSSSPPFGHASGRYYLSPAHHDGAAAHHLENKMLLAQPFFVPCEHTYDRIAVYVTVAEAGRVVRLGVYDHAADSVLPKELLLDAGTASIGSTGKKEITISLTLTPGWYWLAITSDTAGTGRLQGSGTLEGLGLLGYDDANTVSHYYFVSRSFNYAALPSLFGGGIAYRDAAPPRIWLRA